MTFVNKINKVRLRIDFLEILTYNEKNEKGEDVYAAYHSFIYAGDREY